MSGDVVTTGNLIAYGYVSGTDVYCNELSCIGGSSFGTTNTDTTTFNGGVNFLHYPKFTGNTAGQSIIAGTILPLVYYQDNFIRKTGTITESVTGAKTFTDDASFNALIKCGIIQSSWLDASLNLRAYDASCVKLTGNQTISGAKTFTGDVSFNTGTVVFQNGLTTNGSIVSSNSIVGITAMRMSGGSIQTNGGIYFQAADLNRKLTLYPVTSGECGNHSIGVNTTGTNMQFMVPDINRKYTFSYGLTASTKQDILMIDPSGADTSIVGKLTLFDSSFASINRRLVSNQSDFFTLKKGGLLIEDSGEPMLKYSPVSGGKLLEFHSNLRIYDNSFAEPNIAIEYAPEFGLRINRNTEFKGNDIYILLSDGSTNLILGNPRGTIQSATSTHWYSAPSLISAAYTIPKPWDEYYGIKTTGTAYTITLPTITDDWEAGNPITFRKVRETGSAVTVSFITNGTQRLFSNTLTGSTTAVGIMTSTVYYFKLVPMWDEVQADWGWFRVV